MARPSPTGACCQAILSCFSSTVNLKRRDEQVQFASQSCPGERIQPLANRHRLVYKIRASNLDLEPAPGGILADHTQFAMLAVGHQHRLSPDRFSRNGGAQRPTLGISDIFQRVQLV